MKTQYILLLASFLMFVLPTTLLSQVGGSVFEVAKKATDKATDKGTTDSEAKAKEAKDMDNFEKGMEIFNKGIIAASDNSMLVNCLFIMSEHAYTLVELQRQFEQTKDCEKKKEFIEAQALAILSAGTIIYCPDELNTDKAGYGQQIYELIQPIFFPYNYEDKIIAKDLIDKLYKLQIKAKALSEELMEKYDMDTMWELEPLPELLTEFNQTVDMLNQVSRDLAKLTMVENLNNDFIVKILSNFLNAEWKFGNEYPLNPLWLNLEKITDKKTQNEFYSSIVDYFTYYASPKFMAKRAEEIQFLRFHLPCD